MLEVMGSPQTAAPVIHLAGTNGKTSTARMIEAIMRSFGLTTGLATSPSLHSMTERIQLNGRPISERRFSAAFLDIAPALAMADDRSQAEGGPKCTMFEAVTAMAFAAFADAPVDVMIIECGMGGRWDATNVVDAAVNVITPIALDHQAWLGDTVEQIAAEKAGIIRSNAPVVIGHQVPEAQEVLLRSAAAHDAPVYQQGDDFEVRERRLAVGGQVLDLRGLRGDYDDIALPLFGAHQGDNAAMALAAVEAFFGGVVPSDAGDALPLELVADGFAAVTSPGRLELADSQPTVVLDSAHNPHGMNAALSAIEESFGIAAPVVVLGVLADKDVQGIVEVAANTASIVVATQNSSPRAMPAHEVAALLSAHLPPERIVLRDSLTEALQVARERAEAQASGVVVLGSVVTAADARAALGVTDGWAQALDDDQDDEGDDDSDDESMDESFTDPDGIFADLRAEDADDEGDWEQ